MSNPHFHTPITSTRHFHIRVDPFKPQKPVTSTRHYDKKSNGELKIFLSERENAVWNSKKFDKKTKIYIIVEVTDLCWSEVSE